MRASAARKPSEVSASDGPAESSSIRPIAFWKMGSSPFIARRIRRPGTSSRLISLVPSKMRFTRASRQKRSAG